MKYRIKQETKPTLATYGKYKAVALHPFTYDSREIIEEVCKHSPYDKGVVIAVLNKLSQVITRHLRNGDKVRLQDFGLMKLEIESDKVNTPKAFKPRKHIRGVRLHFIPESCNGKQELYQGIKFVKEKP